MKYTGTLKCTLFLDLNSKLEDWVSYAAKYSILNTICFIGAYGLMCVFGWSWGCKIGEFTGAGPLNINSDSIKIIEP